MLMMYLRINRQSLNKNPLFTKSEFSSTLQFHMNLPPNHFINTFIDWTIKLDKPKQCTNFSIIRVSTNIYI